jgi:hypothetical protein
VAQQKLGRLADGRLVFGWCLDCLHEEGCLENEGGIRRLWTPLVQAARRLLGGRGVPDGRKLALMGIAGLALAWGIILAFVGGLKLPGAIVGTPNPLGNGTRSFLVAGGGMMALMSLALWVALLKPRQRRRVAFKFVQVAAALTVFASLAWGIVRHEPSRDPKLILVVTLALSVSWAARTWERRSESVPKPTAPIG